MLQKEDRPQIVTGGQIMAEVFFIIVVNGGGAILLTQDWRFAAIAIVISFVGVDLLNEGIYRYDRTGVLIAIVNYILGTLTWFFIWYWLNQVGA